MQHNIYSSCWWVTLYHHQRFNTHFRIPIDKEMFHSDSVPACPSWGPLSCPWWSRWWTRCRRSRSRSPTTWCLSLQSGLFRWTGWLSNYFSLFLFEECSLNNSIAQLHTYFGYFGYFGSLLNFAWIWRQCFDFWSVEVAEKDWRLFELILWKQAMKYNHIWLIPKNDFFLQ